MAMIQRENAQSPFSSESRVNLAPRARTNRAIDDADDVALVDHHRPRFGTLEVPVFSLTMCEGSNQQRFSF